MENILEYNGKMEYNNNCYYVFMPKTIWVAPFGTRRVLVDFTMSLPEFFIALLSGASEDSKYSIETKIINKNGKVSLKIKNNSALPCRIKVDTKIAKLLLLETKEVYNVENNNL